MAPMKQLFAVADNPSESFKEKRLLCPECRQNSLCLYVYPGQGKREFILDCGECGAVWLFLPSNAERTPNKALTSSSKPELMIARIKTLEAENDFFRDALDKIADIAAPISDETEE